VSLLDPEPEEGDPARLHRESARTADRLRTMSLVRLSAPLPDGSTRAGAAFALAQRLVDRAAELAGRPRRRLPELPDSAVGDVLAVCAHDLAEQVRARAPDRSATAACREAVVALVALRRDL
jgi:hypothetical protein